MAELIESGKTANGVYIGQNTFGDYGIFLIANSYTHNPRFIIICQ